MFIFKGGHLLIRILRFSVEEDFIGHGAFAQGWGDIFHLNLLARVEFRHDIAHVIHFAFFHFVFPAAGVRAGALVWIAFVDVAGKEATAGIRHAECAMHENFQFNIRHLLADFGDFIKRQFAR